MAFTVEVIRGSTTYNISDGSPFRVEMADLLGGASVRNIEESGPFQDGSTHLTERLDPRTLTLKINVIGASAYALDGHRDTLNTIFKPVAGVPIILKLTRDDGVVRQLDTRRTGPLDIPQRAENRPGNLHRAVVQLRAADPTYYNPTEQSEDFLVPSEWWLAYNSIGTASVLEYAESPAQGQLWTNAGSVAEGGAFTIFFRSAFPTSSPLNAYGAKPSGYAFTSNGLQSDSAVGDFSANSRNVSAAGTATTSGTHSYFVQSSSGTILSVYQDNVLLAQNTLNFGNTGPLPGTSQGTARWRAEFDDSRQWTPSMEYAAAYSISLSDEQRGNLYQASLVGSAYNTSFAYAGDVDTYPVISIVGPYADPLITNITTGDILDFTGGTVDTADVWTIDLRYGRKSAVNAAGSSVASFLSDSSDLSTFRLVAAPLATGGTNLISVGGSAIGTAASISLSYHERYLSY